MGRTVSCAGDAAAGTVGVHPILWRKLPVPVPVPAWVRDDVVTVDEAALDAYAATLAAAGLPAPDWRLPIYPRLDARRFVEFVGVFNAINFCFADLTGGDGKYAVRFGDRTWAGATGLAAAIRRASNEGVDLLMPDVLARLDLRTAERVFRSETIPLPLLPQRVAFLNNVGATMLARNAGFSDLVADCGFSAPAVVDALTSTFAAYADDRFEHPVTHETLRFDKRARLFVVMYEGRARASSHALRTLSGVEQIGPIVDYQLPRALRAAGVLRYGPTLAGIVDAGELLPAGSHAELSLRAVTAAAVDALLARVNALAGAPISMVELDHALWVAGRAAAGRHHLTATTAY